jgi:hypothetical protein
VQLHLIQSELVIAPDHPDGGTKVNHISFDVYDFNECEERIKEAGVEYKKVIQIISIRICYRYLLLLFYYF